MAVTTSSPSTCAGRARRACATGQSRATTRRWRRRTRRGRTSTRSRAGVPPSNTVQPRPVDPLTMTTSGSDTAWLSGPGAAGRRGLRLALHEPVVPRDVTLVAVLHVRRSPDAVVLAGIDDQLSLAAQA